MDSSNYPQPSSNHERNAAKNDSSKRPISNATYRQQAWSLPYSLIYYITKNPSTPKCYEKMIQSCKHFFIKNPILLVSNLVLEYDKTNDWHTRIPYIFIDMKNVTNKIWVTDIIHIWSYKDSDEPLEHAILSSIIPKFYKCDNTGLRLCNQNISLDDLKFLATKCEKLDFEYIFVKNKDNSIVELDRIIEALPNVKDFMYTFGIKASNCFSTNTISELLKIPHFHNITHLRMYSIPKSFDIETFYDYIKTNMKTKLSLEFYDAYDDDDDDELSDAYKTRLQEIVNEILEDENRKYKAPHISFPDNDYGKCNKLWCLANPQYRRWKQISGAASL